MERNAERALFFEMILMIKPDIKLHKPSEKS